ncbi:MAG: FAD:protein FMN transferase [Candidatus Eisenbacteria bacterium]
MRSRSTRQGAGCVGWIDGSKSTSVASAGIALDSSLEILAARRVESGILNFGGSIGIVGPPKNADAWSVGIAHPRVDGALWTTVGVRSGCLTTSADSERFHTDRSGRRIHHILDPRSGAPVSGVASVTVWTESGVDGDVDSTASFVSAGAPEGTYRVGAVSRTDLRLLADITPGRGADGVLRAETSGDWSSPLG